MPPSPPEPVERHEPTADGILAEWPTDPWVGPITAGNANDAVRAALTTRQVYDTLAVLGSRDPLASADWARREEIRETLAARTDLPTAAYIVLHSHLPGWGARTKLATNPALTDPVLRRIMPTNPKRVGHYVVGAHPNLLPARLPILLDSDQGAVRAAAALNPNLPAQPARKRLMKETNSLVLTCYTANVNLDEDLRVFARFLLDSVTSTSTWSWSRVGTLNVTNVLEAAVAAHRQVAAVAEARQLAGIQ
jgi:hypothetical protein